MASEFILYSYYRSSASYRVRIALQLKKIQPEYRAIHLLKNGGEQHSAEYKKLNPIAQVPTLIHNGRPLTQTVAILDYLDHVAPNPRLFSEDAYERALVLQICEVVNSGIQPLQNTAVTTALDKTYHFTSEQRTQWIREWNARGLSAIEEMLKNTAGEFAFGDSVTAADCFLVPQIFSANRFNVDLSLYPTIARVCNAAEQLDAFKLAHPSAQPDFEA